MRLVVLVLSLVIASPSAVADSRAAKLIQGLLAAKSHQTMRPYLEDLRALGPNALPDLARALKGPKALEQRNVLSLIRLVTSIGTPESTNLLVALVGKGNRRSRSEIVSSLRKRLTLDASLSKFREDGIATRRGDFWRIAARTEDASRQRNLLVKAGLTLLETPQEFEVAHRVAETIIDRGNDTAVLSLLKTVSKHQPQQQARVLTRLAMKRAQGNQEIFLKGLKHPAPGVRIAAVVNGNGIVPGTREAAHKALANDQWTEVRRGIAKRLSESCGPGDAVELQRSLQRDKDLTVRKQALTGVAACAKTAQGPSLLSIIGDRSQPYGLRTHATTLLRQHPSEESTKKLLALSSELRAEAQNTRHAVALIRAAIDVLGQTPTPAVLRTIRDIANGNDAPAVRAAAILALPCQDGTNLLRRIVKAKEPTASLAAKRAINRCKSTESPGKK